MKKLILIFLFILILPYYNALVQAEYEFPPLVTNNNVNYTKLHQAENMILGKTYENQHLNIRLNRLENIVFNRTYPKLPYEQRINNIIINYKNNVVQNHKYKSPRIIRNTVKSLSNTMGNFFYGYPTGMSPQIYPSYLPPEYHRGIYSNKGWHERNFYNNSGFGVKILD